MFKRLIQGYLVGMANIVPGVSGGTMALVLGIYPRLLAALGNIDVAAVGSVFRAAGLRPGGLQELRQALRRMDAWFLTLIGIGALAAVLTLSGLMTHLLHGHLAATYAFFFGLIIASVVFPYRLLRRRGVLEISVCLAAAAVTVALTAGVDEERVMEKAERKAALAAHRMAGETGQAQAADVGDARPRVRLQYPTTVNAARFFGAAALAIAAMVLPGVSGSFVLLLLGVYFDLLRAVNERDLILLMVFMAGGVFGLLILARLVNACLRRRFDVTMSAMIGLMLGSLWGLWPFKRYMIIADELLILGNHWPQQVSEVLLPALMFVAAVAVVLAFLRLGSSGS